MATSRTAMRATGTIQNRPAATRANKAPSTSTLSASGSRKAPERVVPCLRARWPSMPSLNASTVQNDTAAHEVGSSTIMTSSTGVSTRRSTVIMLAGVSSAPGP